MILRLVSGSRDAVERAEEQVLLVGVDQRHVVVVAEHRHDLLRLALPQQAVIDEDAGELVADRLVDQDGRDGAIDAARQAADHLRVADLLADRGDGLLAVAGHRPVAGEARDADEVLEERRALGRVVDLGVELHGVELPRGVGGDREGRAGRGAEDLEAGREARDVVAMAHPDLLAPGRVQPVEPAFEQVELGFRRDVGAAELGRPLARARPRRPASRIITCWP